MGDSGAMNKHYAGGERVQSWPDGLNVHQVSGNLNSCSKEEDEKENGEETTG